MDGLSVILLGGISFIILTLLMLCATLHYYIATKKFNKNGTVTYGEIVKCEYGSYDPTFNSSDPDYLLIKFNLDSQSYIGTIYVGWPFRKKKLEEKYAIGSKKKIKVLETKNGNHEIRLLKKNKENAGYYQAIIFLVITILMLLLSLYFFLAYLSYKEDMQFRALSNKVHYNETLNNPYIEKFATLNDETIESMNIKFGVEGKLENPSISQVSYVWDVKSRMKIRGVINSDGKLRSVELEAQDDEFYDRNLKFASDISTLIRKPKITYEKVKEKCGGIDGNPIRISDGRANTYVWVSDQYKLTITIGNDGYITSAILTSRWKFHKELGK